MSRKQSVGEGAVLREPEPEPVWLADDDVQKSVEYECRLCGVTRFQIVYFARPVKNPDGVIEDTQMEKWYVCTSCHNTYQPEHGAENMRLRERR